MSLFKIAAASSKPLKAEVTLLDGAKDGNLIDANVPSPYETAQDADPTFVQAFQDYMNDQ